MSDRERDRERDERRKIEHDLPRAPYDDRFDESAGERDLEEEQDVERPEGDAELLDTDSPEFQHLRRRKPGSEG